MTDKLATDSSRNATDADDKYLTIQLDGRVWGLKVTRIQEIVRPLKLHTLPEAPHYIDGLANLRGTFIPVANLRTRLGHAVGEQNERTAIIVVRMPGTGDKGLLGLLVDAVEQVVRIERERLEHPPVGGSGGSCVAGIARLGEQEDFLTVLDIDQICGEFSPTPPPVSAAATPAADAGADMDWFDCGPVAT